MRFKPEQSSPKNRHKKPLEAATLVVDSLPTFNKPLDAAFMSMIQNAHDSKDFSVLRLKDSAKKMGRANSTFWLDVKTGKAPSSIRVGERAVGWLISELDMILAARALASRANVVLDIKQFVALLTAPRLSVKEHTKFTEGKKNA
jgi:prophage regulatory protein